MSQRFINDFHFADWNIIGNLQAGELSAVELSAVEKYNKVVKWAGEARGINPAVFDKLTEWILDDSEWTDDKLEENKQILM